MKKIWIGALTIFFTTAMEHSWKSIICWLDIQNEVAKLLVSFALIILFMYALGNLAVEYGKKIL